MNNKEKQERLLEMMRQEQMQKQNNKAPAKSGKVVLSDNKIFLYSFSLIIIVWVSIYLLGIFDDRDSKFRELEESLVNVEIYRFTDALKSLGTGQTDSDFTSNGVFKIGNGRWQINKKGYWDCHVDGVIYKTIDVDGTEKVKNYMELVYQDLIDRGITSEEIKKFKSDPYWGLDRDDPRWDGLFD